MGQRIKNILILSFFVMQLSCSDSPIIWNKATIIGPDLSMCPCCGGWFVDIEGQQLLMFDWPENARLQHENQTFPLPVKIVWEIPDNSCRSDLIVVKDIRKD